MSAAFTPGPWEFWQGDAAGKGFSRFVGTKAIPNRSQVAHVKLLYCDKGGKETDANAHLIAAAPELYTACKAARGFIENGVALGFIRMPDPETPDSAHKVLPTILSALAKARGETPNDGSIPSDGSGL